MAHGRLNFEMPASSADAFGAFFNHTGRSKWDTLLKVTYVEGSGTHPCVGARKARAGLDPIAARAPRLQLRGLD
jgi:hypothetical protein